MSLEKLREVKQSLYDLLSQGEQKLDLCYRTAFERLVAEGIVPGPVTAYDTEITRITIGLLDRLGVARYDGMDFDGGRLTYYSLPGRPLSAETKTDIDRRVIFWDGVLRRLQTSIGRTPIAEPDYERAVESDVAEQMADMGLKVRELTKDVLSIEVKSVLRDRFNVTKDPPKPGTYESLKELLDQV